MILFVALSLVSAPRSYIVMPMGDSASAPVTAAAPSHPDEGRVVVPPPTDKAVQHHRSGTILWAVDLVVGLALYAAWLWSGAAARVRNAVASRGRWGASWITAAKFAAVFTLINTLITLPFSYYEEYVRPHAYGLSNQTAAKYWADTAKGTSVAIVFSAIAFAIVYALLARSPRRWWLYAALVSIPLLIFVELISPLVIEPLFNDFGPMHDKVLEAKILAQADRAGISGGRVLEVNKSVDTNEVNAYVTGFGSTKRIVLWDTTLRKLDEREVLFILGHEMGHYVLHHVVWSLLLSSLVILATLFVAARTSVWVLARWGERFGFRELSDPASLPLVLLLGSLFGFLVQPGLLAYSRMNEHEADRFGLEITHDNHAAATAFVHLQAENLSIPWPSPLEKWWKYSHPPLGERIEFCNDYHPWR